MVLPPGHNNARQGRRRHCVNAMIGRWSPGFRLQTSSESPNEGVERGSRRLRQPPRGGTPAEGNKMRSGLYRVHGVGGLPDDIRMDDDGIQLPLEERLYRVRGYLPAVEELLWEEDYLSEKRAAERVNAARETTAKADQERGRQDFRSRFRRP
jgi:hypothetical protein